MKTLKFECELLSDVVLNQKSSSEGANNTLDFIPGNNFLGIVAAYVYKEEKVEEEEKEKQKQKKAWEIVHSGKVKFGDAHPSIGDTRGLKVAASMMYPKLEKASESLYIHHKADHKSKEIRNKQLKQCRAGFYDFSNTKAQKIQTETQFAIKSAHDKIERRSKDEQMYGYESLQKGVKMYFEVVCEDSLAEVVRTALIGKKRIGRSRSAQYGLVNISEKNYRDIESAVAKSGEEITIYCDARVILIDEYGQPSFQPCAADLGIEGGEIVWEKSQVRTFQYAPWNFKRQCFDTDRCGIEKGSVFVVKGGNCPKESQYIGAYQTEGFGKVIYNPAFLAAKEDGEAIYRLSDDKDSDTKKGQSELKGSALLVYLDRRKKEEIEEKAIYEKVNKWVDENSKLFSGEFASQWGNIRSIAMRCARKEELKHELIDYLTHGVAKDKWQERKRLDKFKEFVNGLTDENAQRAIINLASEMGKKCKK